MLTSLGKNAISICCVSGMLSAMTVIKLYKDESVPNSETLSEMEYVQQDAMLSAYLQKMYECRKSIDESIYNKLLDSLDKLLFKLHLLKSRKVVARLEDRGESFRLYGETMDFLDQLTLKCKEHGTASDYVKIFQYYLLVRKTIEERLEQIVRLTEDVD